MRKANTRAKWKLVFLKHGDLRWTVTSLSGAWVKTGTRRVRVRLCPVLGKERGRASDLKWHFGYVAESRWFQEKKAVGTRATGGMNCLTFSENGDCHPWRCRVNSLIEWCSLHTPGSWDLQKPVFFFFFFLHLSPIEKRWGGKEVPCVSPASGGPVMSLGELWTLVRVTTRIEVSLPKGCKKPPFQAQSTQRIVFHFNIALGSFYSLSSAN